jgi:hypothetical protein
MPCQLVKSCATDVLKDHSAFIFTVKQSKKIGSIFLGQRRLECSTVIILILLQVQLMMASLVSSGYSI